MLLPALRTARHERLASCVVVNTILATYRAPKRQCRALPNAVERRERPNEAPASAGRRPDDLKYFPNASDAPSAPGTWLHASRPAESGRIVGDETAEPASA
jgi:hypothetical protein